MPKASRENREDILVKSFLVCPNIVEISKKTGISRATIYKIMEKETFKEKLMKAKQEALQNAVSFLQGSLSECADTLMRIIKDNGTSPQTKVNACQVVMGQCKTWTDEIDVISRIAALEEVMEKKGGDSMAAIIKRLSELEADAKDLQRKRSYIPVLFVTEYPKGIYTEHSGAVFNSEADLWRFAGEHGTVTIINDDTRLKKEQMKSIITRLEALEAQSQQSIVLLVTFKDGSTREMGVAEFKELPKAQLSIRDAVRIISGDNLKEFDEYIDTIIGMFADIINNPVSDRNIEDFE